MIPFFFKLDAPCKLDAIQQACVLWAVNAMRQPGRSATAAPGKNTGGEAR